MSEKQSLITMIIEKWEIITGGLAALVTALWGGKAYIKKEIDKAQDDQLKKHSEEINELKKTVKEKIEKDKLQDMMIQGLKDEMFKLKEGQSVMLTKFDLTYKFLEKNVSNMEKGLEKISNQIEEITKSI